MKKILGLFFAFSLLVGLAGCGGMGGGATKVKYPNAVTPAWRDEFNQAERLFEAKNYNQAEKMYKDFVQKYPYNELTDKSNFRLGQIAMLRQAYSQAIQIYQALIQKSPDPVMRSKAGVKLGISYF